MGVHSLPALERNSIGSSLEAASGLLEMNVLKLLETASREVDRDITAAKAVIARAASMLQAHIAGGNGEKRRKIASGGLAGWQERRLQAYIDARFQETIPIETLAVLVNLSVSHFSRAFKQHFGVAPHAYLIRKRLDHARDLLLGTDKSLVEVAYETGFADQQHLCRVFRRAFQTSPGSWRREQAPSRRGEPAPAPSHGARDVVRVFSPT